MNIGLVDVDGHKTITSRAYRREGLDTMGLIQHNSVIISGHEYCRADFQKVYEYAQLLFGSLVTPIISLKLNGYLFFFISPDGSNEGWGVSNANDEKRCELRNFIDSFAYDDGSNGIKYVDVSHGEKGAFVEQTNEKDYYTESEGESE